MISVIIPCKNRIDKLSECIESIKEACDYAKKEFSRLIIEIIIINDHSEEGFSKIIFFVLK